MADRAFGGRDLNDIGAFGPGTDLNVHGVRLAVDTAGIVNDATARVRNADMLQFVVRALDVDFVFGRVGTDGYGLFEQLQVFVAFATQEKGEETFVVQYGNGKRVLCVFGTGFIKPIIKLAIGAIGIGDGGQCALFSGRIRTGSLNGTVGVVGAYQNIDAVNLFDFNIGFGSGRVVIGILINGFDGIPVREAVFKMGV